MSMFNRDQLVDHIGAYRTQSLFLETNATSGLAEEQLYFIKQILTSKIYRRYWPDAYFRYYGLR